MKLYEFWVTDKFNHPKEEILKIANESAREQSGYMEWADGYKLIEQQEPERLPSGEMRYFFEVQGAYLDSVPYESSGDSAPKTNRRDRGVAAASPEL